MSQTFLSLSNSIKVLDENDHAPVIEFPSQKEPACTSITEFHDSKEVVTIIRATDADDPTTPNGQLRFEIRGGSAADLFVLRQFDPWNANVFARSKLNKLYGNYSLDINVKDLGTPSKAVDMKLDICIQDYNDHAPYFVSPINNYTIRVPEVNSRFLSHQLENKNQNLLTFRTQRLDNRLHKFTPRMKTWVSML